MRKITKLIVHCTATPEGRDATVADVNKWHKDKGYDMIGYHYLIDLKGNILKGRNEEQIGAHTIGSNFDSIGIAYVGGMDKEMKKAKDTRTVEQKNSLLLLLKELKQKYPLSQIYGHRNFAKKDCPSFDAKKEYKDL